MKNFSYELEDYVEERLQPSIKKIEKLEEWKELINNYDKFYEKIYCVLSDEYKKQLDEMLSTIDRKTVAEVCLAYKTGLVDGILIKAETEQ